MSSCKFKNIFTYLRKSSSVSLSFDALSILQRLQEVFKLHTPFTREMEIVIKESFDLLIFIYLLWWPNNHLVRPGLFNESFPVSPLIAAALQLYISRRLSNTTYRMCLGPPTFLLCPVLLPESSMVPDLSPHLFICSV